MPLPFNAAQLAFLLSRLPAASQQAIRLLARTKGKTPQEVFAECLKEYLAGRIPPVDVSAALSTTHEVMYNMGYAFGRLRTLARNWSEGKRG